MGIAKRLWMESLEDEYWEERAEWIREQLGDDEADEFTPGWDELSEEYDDRQARKEMWEEAYYDDLAVFGKSPFELFDESVDAVREILKVNVSPTSSKNLLVMLHAHVVAAVEAYLSSTFITYSLSSEDFMRKLVENDPVFAKRKFSIKEIFVRQDTLEDELGLYLRTIIFHDLAKVKPMFHSVLGIDFGDIEWIIRAVEVRHHCVHRAGYDKDGKEVTLTTQSIEELILKAVSLIQEIENSLPTLPQEGFSFWKS